MGIAGVVFTAAALRGRILNNLSHVGVEAEVRRELVQICTRHVARVKTVDQQPNGGGGKSRAGARLARWREK